MDLEQTKTTETCQKDSFQCSYCWRVFMKETQMLTHQTLHRVWHCKNCPKKFGTENGLKNHTKSHCEVHPLQCKTCGQKFKHEKALAFHEKVRHVSEPLECSKCDVTFTRLWRLKAHESKIHGINSMKCNECDEEFSSRLCLMMHKQTHAKVKNIPCSKCDEKFTSKYYLYLHQQTHKGSKPFPCHICSEQFSYKLDRTDHINTQHSDEKIYHCYKCGQSFTSHKEWKNHKGNTCVTFDCELCDMKFAVRTRLTWHIRNNHMNGKPYKCEFCQECFEKKLQLIVHERIHGKDKPFQCKVCSKRYSSRSSLKCHQQVHTGEPLPACKFCKRTFLLKSQLVKHEITHIEGKPFKCDVCPKRYTTNCHLQEHMRVHLQDKSFQCEYCGKLFPYKQSLKVHVRSHTGEKPYHCSICSLNFSDSRQYNNHQKMSPCTGGDGKLIETNSHPETYILSPGKCKNRVLNQLTTTENDVAVLAINNDDIHLSSDCLPYLHSQNVIQSALSENGVSTQDNVSNSCTTNIHSGLNLPGSFVSIENENVNREEMNLSDESNIANTVVAYYISPDDHPSAVQLEVVISNDATVSSSQQLEVLLDEGNQLESLSGNQNNLTDTYSTVEVPTGTQCTQSQVDSMLSLAKLLQDFSAVISQIDNEDKKKHSSPQTINEESKQTTEAQCKSGSKIQNTDELEKYEKTDKSPTDFGCVDEVEKQLNTSQEEETSDRNQPEFECCGGIEVERLLSLVQKDEERNIKPLVAKYAKGQETPDIVLEEDNSKNVIEDKLKTPEAQRSKLQSTGEKLDDSKSQSMQEGSNCDSQDLIVMVNMISCDDKTLSLKDASEKVDMINELEGSTAPGEELEEIHDSVSVAQDNKKASGKTKCVCRKCKNVFPNRYRLDQHRVQCCAKKLECKECKEIFQSSYLLSKHSKSHMKLKPFNCDECSKGFLSSKELKIHKYVHTGEYPFNCRFCEVEFPARKDFIDHMGKNHKGEQPYKCAHCSKTFEYLFPLKEHLVVHSESRPFECDSCNKKFKTNNRLKIHMRIHTGENLFTCDVCNKKFVRRTQLFVHEKTHLRAKLKASKPPEIFDCTECSKVFQNKRQMKRHQKLHKYGRPFLCKYCGRKFIEKCTMVHHEKIHTEGKAYPCQMCQKKFDTIGHLKEHFLVHSGEKPFQCETCGKLFGFRRTLLRHHRVHTGEKPYQCNICNKRFPDAGKVRSHQKHIHIDKTANACVLEVADNFDNVETQVVLDETCDAAIFIICNSTGIVN